MKRNSYSTSTRDNILKEKDYFLQGFHCLLNYWEIKPSQYDKILQDLVSQDITEISTFIPWTHFEKDIHHSILKFLKAAAESKIKVKLLIMPEPGIHFPNIGIPQDLLSKHSNLAADRSGQAIAHRMAPNLFNYPSFSASDVLKSFGNFLLKLSGLLLEMTKNYKNIEVLISHGLYQYYRNPGLNDFDHGDYSASQVFAYKEFLERTYQTEPMFMSSLYEPINRHLFQSFAEKTLVDKTHMIFARKLNSVPVNAISLKTLEALPEVSNYTILREILNFKPDVSKFADLLLESAITGESIHYPSAGFFQKCSSEEKAFLIELALLTTGECFLGVEEFLNLSAKNQRELKKLKSSLDNFEKDIQVTYITPSVKFAHQMLLDKFQTAIRPHFKRVSDVRYQSTRSQKLLILDPKSIVRLVDLVQLNAIAQTGKCIAIPAPFFKENEEFPVNYTLEAFQFFEKFKATAGNALKLKTGLYFEVYESGLGQAVFYETSVFWTHNNDAINSEDLNLFVSAMLGLSESKNFATCLDKKIKCFSFFKDDDAGTNLLFVVNPSAERIQSKLVFQKTMINEVDQSVCIQMDVICEAFSIQKLNLQEASNSDLLHRENDSEAHFGIET